MKNRKRLMICLTAGVLLLAVSATAAFGSVNGYSAYKDALLTLALEEENFTAVGTMSIQLDDTQLVSAKMDYAQDGPDRSTIVSGAEFGRAVSTTYDATIDGVNTWFREDSDYYNQISGIEHYDNFLGFDAEDEMQARLINFLEIAADTVMGDLKNNFVQIGSQDGKDLYQVSISNSQVPALVNAGLSLAAYSSFGGNDKYGIVEYEDYYAPRYAYYEKTTGETLPEDFKEKYSIAYNSAWYEDNQELVNKFEDVISEGDIHQHYNDILMENGDVGVLYVKADGSYVHYPTMAEFIAAHPEKGAEHMDYYVGEDMVLDNVSCTFSLDDQGRVVDTQLQVIFTTTDISGGRHTLTVSAQGDVTNYGTTVIQPLDVGHRTKN